MILQTEFETSAQLYRAYMPFIRYGGLFFMTTSEHQLGERLTARFRLPESAHWHEFEGQVVWINPLGSQGGRPPGVGLAFLQQDNPFKPAIETLLAGELGSDQLTSTM
ncbi:type IV pilus assembly protein PilZ [Ferrimonas marina]|uniref:Type IV pilus assembly protein PilZ n=1 Tax=Ferrimonas marina TaxID=299255 RepID=A0A1M5NI31_9GAMM|nr:type IV pilus assembly protein PilZ [Ferrimonas marina]